MSVLEAEKISFTYPNSDRPIFRDITLRVEKGDHIVLLGPNGAGKTTLLNILCGLLTPQSGVIRLNGANMRALSQREVARNIAYVPQRMSVAFNYTVQDYVLLGRTAHMGLFSTPRRQDHERAFAALECMGMTELAQRPMLSLSGGEQQKACIARALAQEPKLIILDEPTSALDFGNQAHVLNMTMELSRKGYAIVMTTHNPDHPLLLHCQTWLMTAGGHITAGSADEIITNRSLSDLYNTSVVVEYLEALGRNICFVKL